MAESAPIIMAIVAAVIIVVAVVFRHRIKAVIKLGNQVFCS